MGGCSGVLSIECGGGLFIRVGWSYGRVIRATIMVMVVHRFFDPDLPSDLVVGLCYVVGGGEAQHGVLVKRLRVGEEVAIVNGKGLVAGGVVEEVGRRPACVVVNVRSVERVERRGVELCVACAVPKGGRADQLVDQLSQVGVWRWQPIVCERSVVKPRGGKVEKWRRVAVESMKQSGRAYVMEVGGVVGFEEALREAGSVAGGVVYVGDQRGERFGGCDVITEAGCLPEVVTIFIGPEGGFTEGEIDMAVGESIGGRLVCLGEYTMRIETAAVVGAGIIVNGMKE